MQAPKLQKAQELIDKQSYGLDFLSPDKDFEQEQLEKAFGYLDLDDLTDGRHTFYQDNLERNRQSKKESFRSFRSNRSLSEDFSSIMTANNLKFSYARVKEEL